jgi:mevalonate kinase
MLAGEYFAVNGLESFALPIKYGQKLSFWLTANEGHTIRWSSKDYDGNTWFSAEINTYDFLEKTTNNATVSGRICELLQEARKLNPNFTLEGHYLVETELEFNQLFGLGSSSTLVSLIALWAGVQPFDLQAKVFGGSGYDVAVCYIQKPLIYWKKNNIPNWAIWDLEPSISQNWFLCFPGRKVNSRNSIDMVQVKLDDIKKDPIMTAQLDHVLQQIKGAKSTMAMEMALEIWQAFISQNLELPTTYDDLDIKRMPGGLCKYLGAWGGDVILVNKTIFESNKEKFDDMEVVPWNEIVINQ